ncbi:cephalosporin hydroxylase [Bacillus pseudomycoides]|uniref:CmcI family methyltransferase n=1 Tax=Bacillus TaxID=1386 RepID=UPI000363B758|nr:MULTISPECIES: CmcI family methyltransferase [Bacillus]MBD5796828.1 cephalosporin hydroxylase [Bacillus pseudomycoides]MBJ8028771.1 class I SAM-dependent methyltransferase [Bacillus cereus group sp. N21]MED1476026.1 CmcI family methyltransferase [Bacillus pseudomycoides]PEO91228.1 cephalosporin hydroxylase [Bacillus pseudomycoides]PEP64061.1 cephalosporin hydroxylase [Bacillus pseudomycoides]
MKDFIQEFHKYYYDSLVWSKSTKWLGVPIHKCPLDLFLYQEIIYQIKPDLIIECGTYDGGSALFFSSMLDLIQKGQVLSIDIAPQSNLPTHPRLTYLRASSTSSEAMGKVQSMINPEDVVMVILDSDHSKTHVLNELKLYSEVVTTGSYLVVEDTNINGHPVLPNWGPGPMEALTEFLKENNQFVIDGSKHKFFVTFHPNGFLYKVR